MITLRQAASHAPMLDVACKRCLRQGRLSLRRLIAKHGPEYPCIKVFHALEEGCPKQREHTSWDRCFVYSTNPCRL